MIFESLRVTAAQKHQLRVNPSAKDLPVGPKGPGKKAYLHNKGNHTRPTIMKNNKTKILKENKNKSEKSNPKTKQII